MIYTRYFTVYASCIIIYHDAVNRDPPQFYTARTPLWYCNPRDRHFVVMWGLEGGLGGRLPAKIFVPGRRVAQAVGVIAERGTDG